MNSIREYGWKDWISNPKNKSLYEKDMKDGLRQFKMEQQKRIKLVQRATFNQRGY